MTTKNIGQDVSKWTDEWKSLTVESEIQMWDYYGLRPWILKYVPRYGKVVEAGCGLGRYVFLLSRFGIEIEGIDFSKETIDFLNIWKRKNGFSTQFSYGDVKKLPYMDNSINGYLSFGVIEHFIEGPQKALSEAFRVLRPGGIAIITTPSKSWFYYYRLLRQLCRNTIKRILGRRLTQPSFFQYWYSPNQLKSFIEKEGFYIARFSGADVLYTFNEFFSLKKNHLEQHPGIYWLSTKLENSIFHWWGAQSVVLAIKPAEIMHCFLCGELLADKSSLNIYDVPICLKHKEDKASLLYIKKNKPPTFKSRYQIQTEAQPPHECLCDFTGRGYTTDPIFENYGFSKNINPELLKIPEMNIKISSNHLQPIWRKRKSNI
jgi:ubiquinone/menaquinone biosynthesis C-methylase UbiE